MHIHVVKSGDNLYRLSKKYGVSVARIIRANGLENPSKLLQGQSIVIPTPYPRYTVKESDNLRRIAREHGTTVQAITQANRLTNPIYPGQRLSIPVFPPSHDYSRRQMQASTPSGKPTIEVNAFVTQFGSQGAQKVREVASALTYLTPFAYRIQPDGGLQPIDDSALIEAATANAVVPIMGITNFTATEAGTPLAHTVLSSTSIQNTLLSNILSTMKSKGYRGLNIDFENVSPEDREAYNQFLQRAVDRLHPEGYFVSSSLAPKTSANQKGLLYEAHDYPAHGRILDFVVLMTYEWGYRFGPPQAISPINQIRRVLDYAVTVIPNNKIFMGFQVYARDWLLPHVQGQEAETFDMQEAIRRAIQYNAVIEYDTASQSPYYNYTDAQGRRHEVWFEDARSAQAKFDLVKSLKLRGVSYWVLEYPFPQNWSVLEENFTIRKLS